jgi:hypothetical protein
MLVVREVRDYGIQAAAQQENYYRFVSIGLSPVEGPFPWVSSVLGTLSRYWAAFAACGKVVHNAQPQTWKTSSFVSVA